MTKYLDVLLKNHKLCSLKFSHTSKYALPHAELGFVSFGSDLLSGGGGNRELLFAKIPVWYGEVSCVLSLEVYRLQRVHHCKGKNKQVCHKTFSSFGFSAFVQSAF